MRLPSQLMSLNLETMKSLFSTLAKRVTKGRRFDNIRAASTKVATVTKAFDPPFYDKSIERMEESHYWVKEFMPLSLGVLSLGSGEQTLKLEAPKIPGAAAIDVHSIQIVRRDS